MTAYNDNITLKGIRPLRGSQHHGFEELCTQLAELEPRPVDTQFYRKGPGPDGGVECVVEHADGKIWGWQAKWFDHLGDDQIKQIGKSFQSALNRHPGLSRWIVCIPINLKDAKRKTSKSELEWWQQWRASAIARAAAVGRFTEIQLWSESNILSRLTRAEPAYAGRLKFWLGKDYLTPRWFKDRFEEAKKNLGNRYLPEHHIDLPISKTLRALIRAPGFDVPLQRLVADFDAAASQVRRSLRNISIGNSGEIATFSKWDAIDRFVDATGDRPTSFGQPYQVAAWRDLARDARSAIRQIVEACGQVICPDDKKDAWRGCINDLWRFTSKLSDIEEELKSDLWDATNKKALMLRGPAGIGKSHLVGDFVAAGLDSGYPGIVILSSMLNITDAAWGAVARRLGIGDTDVTTVLGALDAAGQAAGVRCVVCVDALNEGASRLIWPAHLIEFIQQVSRFSYVAVVITCRDVFVSRLVLAEVEEEFDQLVCTLEVPGFHDATGATARNYMVSRGVSGWLGLRPGEEISNPLFLRTCCDAVLKSGQRELPRGMDGVTQIFQFYLESVIAAVNTRLALDHRRKFVEKFIAGFAALVAESPSRYVHYDRAHKLASDVWPAGQGTVDQSLVNALESEGLLSVEPQTDDDGDDGDGIRFTFERYSDHAIAKSILDHHAAAHDISAAYVASTPLGKVLTADWHNVTQGIVDALALQIAERHDMELADLPQPDDVWVSWDLHQAFESSLHWRAAKSFTPRTIHWASKFSGDQDGDGAWQLFLEVAGQSDNPFNADWLHGKLISDRLVNRDLTWSAAVARIGFDESGPIRMIVDWALFHGPQLVDPVRAELIGTVLCWLFTTSHREVRDKATKALTSLLANKAETAVALLSKFRTADDPYVSERLHAAIYGAALHSRWADAELASVARAVLEQGFSNSPSPNVLLRDYAQGIVTVAHRRKVVTDEEAKHAKRPYRLSSAFPIDLVTEEDLKEFVSKRGRDTADDVVDSCLTDDFKHYVIDPRFSCWGVSNPHPSGALRSNALATQWLNHFGEWANEEQTRALQRVVNAQRAMSTANRRTWEQCPENAELKDAVAAFRLQVGELVHENFRICTYLGFMLATPAEPFRDRPQEFDRIWAARWVAKRAHEIGWSSQLFDDVEESIPRTHERHVHRVERLGKKYQWIALYELLGMLSDHVQFLDRYEDEGCGTYDGAWQLDIRNIDPSMLRRETQDDGWRQWDATWWAPRRAKLACESPSDALAWLQSEIDVVNDEGLIDLKDQSGTEWLCLSGRGHWRVEGKRRHPRQVSRESWYHLHCYVVRQEQLHDLVKWLASVQAPGGSVQEEARPSEMFLGEHPWHGSARGLDDWISSDGWSKPHVPFRMAVVEYGWKDGYDYSMEDVCQFDMPAGWLSDALELRLTDGHELTWEDKDGKVTFFDPAVSQPGPKAALVRKGPFLSALSKQGLAPVWLIYGQKEVHGSDSSTQAYGGRQQHQNVYYLEGKQFVVKKTTKYIAATAEQQAALLRESAAGA